MLETRPSPLLKEKKILFIYGISGYVASNLAMRCQAEDLISEFVEVHGTIPFGSEPKPNVNYMQYPLTEMGELSISAIEAFNRCTHVLSVVPTNSDTTLEDGRVELRSKQGKLKWAGYLSTTGTYGDRRGGVVFEDDEIDLSKVSKRGRARLEMENKWLQTGAPVHLFRLPSIYGPGRRMLSKRKFLISKPGQVFCRIHVEDLVQILIASMRKPNPGRIYNCCDDEPCAPHVASQFTYALLGLEAPPLRDYSEIESELSEMERSFYQECKRVTNHRVKMELDFVPKFPTYREGLADCCAKNNVEFTSSQGKRKPTPASKPSSSPSRFWFQRINMWYVWLVRYVYRASFLLKWLCLRSCVILLVDNGSVREEPTISMQRLASKLEATYRWWPVRASSWKHIQESLPSRPTLFSSRLVEFANTRRVVVLPLFLGPSAIVTREIPKLFSRSSQVMAKPMVDVDNVEGCLVTQILLNHCKNVKPGSRIVLVDHGSPNAEVNRVRRALAARLRALLWKTAVVVDCSMERRPEHLFNLPLLTDVFDLGGLNEGHVIVLPVFLFAGNHAGPGGDIVQICEQAMKTHPKLQIEMKGLVFDPRNDLLAMELFHTRLLEVM